MLYGIIFNRTEDGLIYTTQKVYYVCAVCVLKSHERQPT